MDTKRMMEIQEDLKQIKNILLQAMGELSEIKAKIWDGVLLFV